MIRTDPPAGEQVEQDTTINLVVSSGRDQQAVPSIVIGRTEADARQLLENPPYSFVVSTVTEETNDVAAGLVIRTKPAAGTLVDIGGADHARRVERRAGGRRCPTSSGETEATARSRSVGRSTSASWSRTCRRATPTTAGCIAQSVAAGQQAPAGSPIQLTVGRAAAPHRRRRPPRRPPRRTTAAPTTAVPTDRRRALTAGRRAGWG